MKKDLLYFIEEITNLKSFHMINYYMRCMKKQPHGGIGYVYTPNYYLKHRIADTESLFRNYKGEIPHIFRQVVSEVSEIYCKSNINIEDLLTYCFEDINFWYAWFRVLKPKSENSDSTLLWYIVDNNLKFNDYYELDNINEILYAFISFLIYSNIVEIESLQMLLENELLLDGHNKYGLNELPSDVEFFRQGFKIDNKYYLYNIFFDTSIGDLRSEVPLTINIFESLNNAKIFMRCDENLAIDYGNHISTATVDAQKFRGINLALADIESLISGKEIIVHFDPDSLNKLLVVAKKDFESDGSLFYHIGIEELWNPDKINDNNVAVNYIHAKYFPKIQGFNHIDFSINQYPTDVFRLKYNDAVNNSNIPIDKYADIHYKIWCVESERIEINQWSALVSATLDIPFRNLFFEIFPQSISSDNFIA